MMNMGSVEDNSNNLEFVRLYLLNSGLSTKIIEHPRFESIVWRVCSILRRSGFKAYSKEAMELLKSIVVVQKDGSIVIVENKPMKGVLNSVKYYYDESEKKLRRIICDSNQDGVEITRINTYSDDGLEESLLIDQNCLDGIRYYSKTTRVPERIDMVMVERIEEVNGKKELLSPVYQIRTFCAAYEDIDPLADDIDPLDKIGFSFLGVPEIYRDLEEEELKVIGECDGEIFPLDDVNKEEQFASYVETNKFYGRTRAFENAVASFLSIDSGYSSFR